MNKKGAVEMIETIMVLLVVIILIVIGIVFYFRSTAAGIQETGAEICQLSGNDLLVAVTAMPELQCSIDTVAKDCIDLDKVAAFQALLKDRKIRDQYNSFFSGSCPKAVRIELLYPVPGTDEECQIGEQIGSCKTWSIFEPKQETGNTQLISTPVSIHSRDRYYIGNLVVEART